MSYGLRKKEKEKEVLKNVPSGKRTKQSSYRTEYSRKRVLSPVGGIKPRWDI